MYGVAMVTVVYGDAFSVQQFDTCAFAVLLLWLEVRGWRLKKPPRVRYIHMCPVGVLREV